MTPTTASNDLAEHAQMLAEIQDTTRMSRPGIGDPQRILTELGSALRVASNKYDEILKQVGTIDMLSLLKFMRQQARACAQFLEYAQDIDLLPNPDTGAVLDVETSKRYRLGLQKVIKEAGGLLHRFLGESYPPLIRLELEALLLSAKFHNQKWLLLDDETSQTISESILLDAERLLAKSDLESQKATPDLEELLPWIRVSALRVLLLMHDSPEQAALALMSAGENLIDKNLAWELSLVQLQLAADSGATEDVVRAFSKLASAAKELPWVERAGMLVMATNPVTYAAAALVDSRNLDTAADLLETYSQLGGYLHVEGNLLQLFVARGNVYGILTVDGERSVITSKLNSKACESMFEASLDGNPNRSFESRKALGRSLRSIIEAILSTSSLTLDPIGLTAWWPWHAFSTGSGVSLSLETELHWRHPRQSEQKPSPLQIDDAVLVVDTALSQSKTVINAWRRLTKDRPDAIFAFDSDAGGVLPEDMLKAIDSASFCIYYGHGISDPLDASGRGLGIGPDSILTLHDITGRKYLKLESLILVACEAGRSTPFLPGASPAHGFAMAGVSTVVSTLWTIYADAGAMYVKDLIKELEAMTTAEAAQAWRALSKRVTPERTPFFCMTQNGV